MGRGRTTTGMVAASMIATVASEGLSAGSEEEEGDESEVENGAAGDTARYLDGRSVGYDRYRLTCIR
jgi:hypothetical protein